MEKLLCQLRFLIRCRTNNVKPRSFVPKLPTDLQNNTNSLKHRRIYALLLLKDLINQANKHRSELCIEIGQLKRHSQ